MKKSFFGSFLPQQIDAVILADGAFPTQPELLKLLMQHERVVCCDGAAERLVQLGKLPAYAVGDLDSISSATKILLGDKLIHQSDQETNDLTKAVQFCIENGWRNCVIMGATGKREDHTLANISLLATYQGLLDEVVMLSDYGAFVAMNKTSSFTSYQGQQVSIFSLTPACPISVQGLQYAIEKRPLNTWWEGTLNESSAETFTIKLHDEGQFIVFMEW